MKSIGFVYMWINKINGRKYIGKHCGSKDDGYIGSGGYFRRAVQKYGLENFERKILWECYTTEEDLYHREYEIINELNAVFSSDYYNQTNLDPRSMMFIDGKSKRVMGPEARKKISEAAKLRVFSEETKKKMGDSRRGKPSPLRGRTGITSGTINGQYGKKWYNNGETDMTFIPGDQPDGWVLGRVRGIMKGEKNGFFGKTHTDEVKQKSSVMNKGRLVGDKNPSKRPEVREKISRNRKGKGTGPRCGL